MISPRILLLSLPLSLLLGACASKPKVVYVQAPAALPPTDSNKVRIADRVHAYSVGRLPTADGLAMNEAHQYYQIEDSAHWDQRLPDHPMQSSGPLGKFAPPTARRVAVSKEVHAAEAQNEALALSMTQARDTYRGAATQLQAQSLGVEKMRVMADSYRALLETSRTENSQLKAENARLRAAVDNPAPAASPTPGPRDSADPYERLKEWDQKSGSPAPSPTPTPR